jgi:hypothetical protein
MEISSILIYQADSIEGAGERLDLRGSLYCEDLDAIIGDSVEATLEAVFEAGNLRRDELLPKLRHSISVGDVVALTDDDGETSHYVVAGCGFEQVRCSEHYDDTDHTAFIRVHGAA